MTKGGPRIGKCIYCGATLYSEKEPKRPMGREHVIAKKLGGIITVLEAVCAACEEEINKNAENIVINTSFNLLRHHLGLPSSDPKETAMVDALIESGAAAKWCQFEVPIDEVPVQLQMPLYDGPGIITGRTADNLEMKPKSLHPTKLNTAKEAALKKKLGARGIRVPPGEFHYEPFARMLAKIAHAWTVHELGGPEMFKPYLTNHILGKPDRIPLSQFIGTPSMSIDVRNSNGESIVMTVSDGKLHRLGLMQGFGCYQVYIQLFGVFDMAHYIVVSGERI